MKFYMRDPDAFFAGVAKLTLEQIGAYCLLIDRLYALDGVLPDDDVEVARTLNLDPRLWKRLKRELMAAGKVRIRDGFITANGVDERLLVAKIRSTSAKHAADVRWINYRKAKEINDPLMRAGNASISTNIKEEDSCPVNSGDNSEPTEPKPERKDIASPELKAAIRRKAEFDKTWR